jgi:hypothetical protein
MDYRPVANAGPNQVITLPRNAVTLHGNQSADDHEPLAYEWSLSPESKGKVVEMQVREEHQRWPCQGPCTCLTEQSWGFEVFCFLKIKLFL